MNLAKWRIKKNRVSGKWDIFRPLKRWTPEASMDDYPDALEMIVWFLRWEGTGFK